MRSLMVVDDDDQVRLMVEETFKRMGIPVRPVSGGEACIQELREGFRGIILMDIEMPVMDGWETIRKMVELNLLEGNVVLMLTGNDQPDSRMSGLEEVVTDFIRKPVSPDRLRSLVGPYFDFME